MKYLPRVDRAGVLRRMGSVLTLDKVALRRAIVTTSVFLKLRSPTAAATSENAR